jgi:phosphoribosylglycinamide formyltransferase-1
VNKQKAAVLISGNGSNLQALIDACKQPDFPVEITAVISNKEEAYGLNRASEAGIPCHVIKHGNYATREAFDKAMHEQLLHHCARIVCLAGFMRMLSPWFVAQWQGRMLNIHPSLLPAFKGASAVRDALNAGLRETGCSVHVVTDEMDAGEVLLQAKVPILPGDSEESLHQRIHAQEHRIYPQALKMLALKLVQGA